MKAGATIKETMRRQGRMDFVLLGTVIVLCVFGLVMVLSASYYNCYQESGDGFRDFKRQLIYFILGFGVLMVASSLPYKVYQNKFVAGIFALVAVALCIAVILFGTSNYGAQRWLNVGGVTVQPSEIMKAAIVLVMSCFIAQYPQGVKKVRGFAILSVIFLLMVLPVLAQRNLSTLMILGGIYIAMIFIANVPFKLIGVTLGLVLIAGVVLALAEDYRVDRITSFLNPWEDAQETGYQLVQSLVGIGSGGFFGTGLNFSRQKLMFLPFPETDCIFAIIAEELGFFGCLLLVAGYALLAIRGVRIALRCKRRFGSLLAGGITITICIQALVHIMVCLGLFPTTGQTLPFISSGGSSLIVFMGLAGILLNISRYDVANAVQYVRETKPAIPDNVVEIAAARQKE
ncbi:MAG: putative lipid II flippase FtsW [Clostridia bacterium]|nr:putative lipid II flippase FtsW [Clostridia bacterium]